MNKLCGKIAVVLLVLTAAVWYLLLPKTATADIFRCDEWGCNAPYYCSGDSMVLEMDCSIMQCYTDGKPTGLVPCFGVP